MEDKFTKYYECVNFSDPISYKGIITLSISRTKVFDEGSNAKPYDFITIEYSTNATVYFLAEKWRNTPTWT